MQFPEWLSPLRLFYHLYARIVLIAKCFGAVSWVPSAITILPGYLAGRRTAWNIARSHAAISSTERSLLFDNTWSIIRCLRRHDIFANENDYNNENCLQNEKSQNKLLAVVGLVVGYYNSQVHNYPSDCRLTFEYTDHWSLHYTLIFHLALSNVKSINLEVVG